MILTAARTRRRRRRRRASPGDPRKAISYVRVSTDRQALGPDAQRELIERWATKHGVELVEEHVDSGVSGGSEVEDRPGLVAAIDALRSHGAGVLVVAKRDRLARDVGVAALVERHVAANGGRIIAADGNGNGDDLQAQLAKGMADLIAQHERGMISQRTKAALKVKKDRGERTGSVRYGFRLAADGVHLVPDRREQRTIQVACELREEGLSYRDIAERLDEMGLGTRNGGPWGPVRVRRMVLRRAGLPER